MIFEVEVIKFTFIAIATPVILVGLNRLLGSARPRYVSDQRTVIRTNQTFMLASLALGLACLAGSVYFFFIGETLGWIVMLGVIGVLFSFFGAFPIFANLDVAWDEAGISGPSKCKLGILFPGRTQMAWREIRKTGSTISDYWFIEACDRRRVYYSGLYNGHKRLTEELERRRPDLEIEWQE